MIRFLTRPAARLDQWLHARLGRPYGVLLSIGLMVDIGHRVMDAPKHIQEKHRLIGEGLAIIMELALLLHQVGEMHERLSSGAHEASD